MLGTVADLPVRLPTQSTADSYTRSSNPAATRLSCSQYDFFRRLKDQDAEEIRGLQAALVARDADLRGLRLEMEREQQQHKLQMAAAAAKQQGLLQQLPSPPSPSRWKQGGPATHTSEAPAAGGYGSPAKQQPSPTRGKGWSGPPLLSLIVPPVLSPARPFFK